MVTNRSELTEIRARLQIAESDLRLIGMRPDVKDHAQLALDRARARLREAERELGIALTQRIDGPLLFGSEGGK